MEPRQTRARKVLEELEETRLQVGRLRYTVKLLQNKCSCGVTNYDMRINKFFPGHQESWDILSDQKTLLQQKEQQLARLEQQLESWIDLLPKPRWRMVLRYHYLDGMNLADVAQEMSRSTGREFSMHQVYRFHRVALEAAEKLWPLS